MSLIARYIPSARLAAMGAGLALLVIVLDQVSKLWVPQTGSASWRRAPARVLRCSILVQSHHGVEPGRQLRALRG